MIFTITKPTLGSLENATFKDKTLIWFLGFIINYQHDLQLLSQRIFVIHLQPQEQHLEKNWYLSKKVCSFELSNYNRNLRSLFSQSFQFKMHDVTPYASTLNNLSPT
jgi:hypothetical protein